MTDIEQISYLIFTSTKTANFFGHDPYDGLNSRLFRALGLSRVEFFRLVWIQVFRRSPIDLRGLTGVPKGFNPKAGGLFLAGACRLAKDDAKYLSDCKDLWQKLSDTAIKTKTGLAWGYNFDWQAKAFFVPRGTPNVVSSVYVGMALLDYYELAPSDELKTHILGVRDFILNEMIIHEDTETLCFAYIPGKKTEVHNASLWAAAYLARVDTKWPQSGVRAKVEKAVRFSLQDLQADGTWPYGTEKHHRWMDNFHTGYNLEALLIIRKAYGLKEYDEPIQRVLTYYLRHFFLVDGTPKYTDKKRYPLDIHTLAEVIILFTKLLDEKTLITAQERQKIMWLLEQNLNISLTKFWDNKSQFYYQESRWGMNKIPYIRWSQAWMFYALSLYTNSMSQVLERPTQQKPLYPEKRKRFFGSSVDALTMAETLEAVDSIIAERTPTQHVVINVAKLVIMQKDERLRDIVNNCSLINADGQGIVWGARFLGIPIPERVTGIDLFHKLIELANKKNYKVFFLGAHEEVVTRVVEIFSEKYPGLKVAGYNNGYYRPEDEQNVVEKIRQSEADMLFVAMGSPNKEYFLNKYVQAMQVPFVMGVGGSFDVVAGVTRRAPAWMQKYGLEWFYRIVNEPRRMTPRYVKTNAAFFVMMMKALVFGKKKYGCS